MRDALAERLLAQVMGWSPEDVARERPDLQALAAYKYDEYQQFSPGMRFVESLAVWLNRFETMEERHVAYDFIKKRLVFISHSEMRYLVSITYPDVILPILLKEAALLLSVPDFKVVKIANSKEFRLIRRKSLFLGLSDGAHIDDFRRANDLSNEQVHIDYRIEEMVAKELGKKLRKDIHTLSRNPKIASKASFEIVFLLNDFSASSDTLLRIENGIVKGKIARAMDSIRCLQQHKQPLVARDELKVFVVLYIATETAIKNLSLRLSKLRLNWWPHFEVRYVYLLSDKIRISPKSDHKFHEILEKYYDPAIMDSHLKKGGSSVIYGYAGCGLPVVLSHNTPNNSVYLLWGNKHGLRTCALFPRVSRHREDI